jgi:hypothetical protein
MAEEGVILSERGIPQTNTPEAEIEIIKQLLELLKRLDTRAQCRVIRFIIGHLHLRNYWIL